MPFRTATGGFANNANMGDFIANAVDAFLTDAKGIGGLGWISQTPNEGAGTGSQIARLYSRGSIGSEAPPFWFPRTHAKTLWSFTGSGVNTAQETYDQPGNPMNYPFAEPPVDIVSGYISQMASMGMTTVVGPYDGYWFFSDETASYFHMIIKVSQREYRHFHVGMLQPLHPDVDADTFYITSHRWAGLSPDNLGSRNAAVDTEHKPYGHHILPFACQNANNAQGESLSVNSRNVRSQGLMLYSPAYGTDAYDWWLMSGTENSGTSGGGGGTEVAGQYQQTYQPGNVRSVETMGKPVGDVNDAPGSVLFGWGQVTGYDDSLGTVLFECEPTFTTDGIALIPIYTLLHSNVEAARRWGPMGQVPDVFRVNMKSLDPEQEISIGSDTYVVFPMINKDANATTDGEGYSGYEGLAYRKVTANAT